MKSYAQQLIHLLVHHGIGCGRDEILIVPLIFWNMPYATNILPMLPYPVFRHSPRENINIFLVIYQDNLDFSYMFVGFHHYVYCGYILSFLVSFSWTSNIGRFVEFCQIAAFNCFRCLIFYILACTGVECRLLQIYVHWVVLTKGQAATR